MTCINQQIGVVMALLSLFTSSQSHVRHSRTQVALTHFLQKSYHQFWVSHLLLLCFLPSFGFRFRNARAISSGDASISFTPSMYLSSVLEAGVFKSP